MSDIDFLTQVKASLRRVGVTVSENNRTSQISYPMAWVRFTGYTYEEGRAYWVNVEVQLALMGVSNTNPDAETIERLTPIRKALEAVPNGYVTAISGIEQTTIVDGGSSFLGVVVEMIGQV